MLSDRERELVCADRRERSVAGGGELLAGGNARQRDLEERSFARLAFDANVATVIADDAVADGQTQARAFADLFGGEEWIVNLDQMFRGNTAARVVEANEDGIVAGCSGNLQPSALWHGVAG